MTTKEAWDTILKIQVKDNGVWTPTVKWMIEDSEAFPIINNLISKATPMKLQMRHYDKSIFRDIGLCECSKWCSEYENYCSECGRKLDWSDEK